MSNKTMEEFDERWRGLKPLFLRGRKDKMGEKIAKVEERIIKKEVKQFISEKLKEQKKELIEKFKEIVGEIEKEKIIYTTIDDPCRCNFGNGDIVTLDKDGKHKECGKKLPTMKPIKTTEERILDKLDSLK